MEYTSEIKEYIKNIGNTTFTNLKILIIDGEDETKNITITNEDIHSDSVVLKSALCEDEELTFGGCIASEFSFTASNYKDTLVVGKKIKVTFDIVDIDDTVLVSNLPVGEFYIASATNSNDKSSKDIVAYDRLYSRGDVDVSDFYNNVFPKKTDAETGEEYFEDITLRYLLHNLLLKLNISFKSSLLVNDSVKISKNIIPNGNLLGIDLLRMICVLQGGFGYINRDGFFDVITISNGIAKTNIYNDSETGLMYKDFDVEENSIKEITCINISNDADDIGTTCGTDTSNPYVIQGNYLLYGKNAEELEEIGLKALTKINQISYYPFECTAYGTYWLELGDNISICNDNIIYSVTLLKREIRGFETLLDCMSASGKETRDNFVSTNTEIDILKNKTLKITKTVDEFSSRITNVEENEESLIQQTSSAIVMKVDKNGNQVLVSMTADPDTAQTKYAINANNIEINSDNFTVNDDGVEVKGENARLDIYNSDGIYFTVDPSDENIVEIGKRDVSSDDNSENESNKTSISTDYYDANSESSSRYIIANTICGKKPYSSFFDAYYGGAILKTESEITSSPIGDFYYFFSSNDTEKVIGTIDDDLIYTGTTEDDSNWCFYSFNRNTREQREISISAPSAVSDLFDKYFHYSMFRISDNNTLIILLSENYYDDVTYSSNPIFCFAEYELSGNSFVEKKSIDFSDGSVIDGMQNDTYANSFDLSYYDAVNECIYITQLCFYEDDQYKPHHYRLYKYDLSSLTLTYHDITLTDCFNKSSYIYKGTNFGFTDENGKINIMLGLSFWVDGDSGYPSRLMKQVKFDDNFDTLEEIIYSKYIIEEGEDEDTIIECDLYKMLYYDYTTSAGNTYYKYYHNGSKISKYIFVKESGEEPIDIGEIFYVTKEGELYLKGNVIAKSMTLEEGATISGNIEAESGSIGNFKISESEYGHGIESENFENYEGLRLNGINGAIFQYSESNSKWFHMIDTTAEWCTLGDAVNPKWDVIDSNNYVTIDSDKGITISSDNSENQNGLNIERYSGSENTEENYQIGACLRTVVFGIGNPSNPSILSVVASKGNNDDEFTYQNFRIFGQEDHGGKLVVRADNGIDSLSSAPECTLGQTNFPWTYGFFDNLKVNGTAVTSDRKAKNDIKELSEEDAVKLIYGLDAKTFKYNNAKTGKTHMGFIAQDVASLCDDLEMPVMSLYDATVKGDDNDTPYVDGTPDDKLTWYLNYAELIAPLVKTVQSQNKKIISLEERIAKLEEIIANLAN